MIKQNPKTLLWEVSYTKRHPVTRKPKGLRRVNIKTKAEANRAYQEIVHIVNKSIDDHGSHKMTWAIFLQKFYQDLEDRDLAVATVENYKFCLNAHTLARWGSKALGDIGSADIKKLIKEDLADKSKSHQKSMRKYINGAFTYAIECKYLNFNPVPRMQFRMGNKLKPVLKESEVATLLAKAEEYNHPWSTVWCTAAYSGLRNEELYSLRWVNVDLEQRFIFVRESWTKTGGFKDLTKTGDDRVVEIAPPLVKILEDLKTNQESVFVLPRLQEWEGGRQAEILRAFLLSINLPPVNFHNLRATWATILLSKGVELVKVMKMGGWKDLKTISKHYLRLSGVDIRGASDVLNFKSVKSENI